MTYNHELVNDTSADYVTQQTLKGFYTDHLDHYALPSPAAALAHGISVEQYPADVLWSQLKDCRLCCCMYI